MAKTNKLCYLTTILFFFVLVCQSPSSARPLNVFAPANLAATEPHFNLVLPGGNNVNASPANPSHFDMGVPPTKKFAAGKYGPLLLNCLPKGTTTPSGPSKGTNNMNN